MTSRVLVVDDDSEVRKIISAELKASGYDAVAVDGAEPALVLLQTTDFDLAILDWQLTGQSGIELCKQIRASEARPHLSKIPILMVTAMVAPSDIVCGLDAGADDFLAKPFQYAVLMARVRALTRRSAFERQALPSSFTLGALSIDVGAQRVQYGNRLIDLTRSEFKLLIALVKNRGRVLTRESLMAAVEGEGVTVIKRAIDTHVTGLRKKLGKCSTLIETVRGVGYRVGTVE